MKISAIACNYNGAEFIADAVESVLANQDPDLEVIVVDDGSTDASREILAQYQNNPKVKLVFQDNLGQAGAFNAGIKAAQGDTLCIFDGDDFWFPHKARTIREGIKTLGLGDEPWLIRHPLLSLYEHERTVVPRGRMTYDTPEGAKPIDLGEIKQTLSPKEVHAFIEADGFGIYGGGNFGGSSAMSRAMAEKVFPLPILSKFYGDMMPLYAGPIVGNFYILARQLGAYRFHGTNHSLTRKLEPLEFWDGMSEYLNRILQAEGIPVTADYKRSRRARPYLIAEGRSSEAVEHAKRLYKQDKRLIELVKTHILIAKAKLGR